MTAEDKIKGHFSAMAECTGNLRVHFDSTREVENDEVIQYLQKQLDAIKELLEPEPETLASSVLRLTDICNNLDRENALLRNDLTEMTLNFNAVKKRASQLGEEVVCKNDLIKTLERRLAVVERAFALQKRYLKLLVWERSNT